MNSIVLTAARLLFLLSFLGMLPENMKTQNFITTHLEVNTGKLENPVRIAVLSDLHLYEYGPDNADLVRTIHDEQPDLITVAGDMVIKKNPEYGSVITLCLQLTEIAPVYYVHGNHEYDNITKLSSKIGEDLQAAGVQVLDSEWRTITVNGNSIDIAGIPRGPRRYNWTDQVMMADYLQSPNFRLLLLHDPGFFDPRITTNPDITLIGKPIDVVLCGHRHGGQIDIPLVGGMFHPDVGFFPNLTFGDNLVGKTHVIVSRGLSDHNGLPRLNNPYELLIITLK